MAKSTSIVDARRDLGRLPDEVRRTGQAVVLTRRGRPVARLASQPPSSAKPARAQRPLAGLRGSVKLLCPPDELLQTIRELRREFTVSLAIIYLAQCFRSHKPPLALFGWLDKSN
jgi:prevent-host-death family protein